MALSTNQIAGLSSGFDWRTMVDQLMAVEHRRVDLITARKTETQSKLTEWQTVNTQLLALKTAANTLRDPDSFQVFSSSLSTDSATVKASDLLSVSTSTTAAPGTYSIKVANLAQAQKLSSNPFTSATTALGSAYAGGLIINGKVVTVNATDTLGEVATSINDLNTGANPSGVTASIVNFGTNDYRLILTSDETGADGISLLNGSAVNLVQAFGWKDNQAATIKNSITLGAQSDRFTSSTAAVGSLLGIAAAESGSVTIGDKSVLINLATMSLTDIKTAINTAAPTGTSASVISQTIDGTTTYRLQIDGTQTFGDTDNMLNTLGILDNGSSNVTGKVSGISLTTQGASITAATLLKDIDGYNTFTAGGSPAGDYLTLTGKDTANGDVSATFDITSSTTVQGLLDEITARYGNVLAYVTNDGKIRVDDLSGGGALAVNLTDHIADVNSKLEFVAADADFGAADVRKREIVAGEDAAVELDGVTVTNSSNTITDVIAGTTLNLIKEDNATTAYLTIGRNIQTIKSNIESFVSKYNDVMSYINSQFTYDAETQKAGGVLFGDTTLSSIKSEMSSLLTQTIWGVSSNFSIMGLIGITLDSDHQLTVNDATLTGYLETNFNDVKSLFSAQGSTTGANLSYVAYTQDTKAGDYTVHVNRAATQASETGSINLTAGGAADTLTITQGTATASVAITAGMAVADIVNALTTEFNAVYTQTLSGGQALKQDDNITPITAATTWDNIFGATLENGDVISFTGDSRTGAEKSGSYTITNVAEDTVQGLLAAIENTFANQVTATIDTSGRITVTDKFTGTSQLSVEITEPDARGLDFGAVLTSNPGGVTGRYALDMVAADDGSGHLIVRNENYGSGSFTVSQDSTDNNYDQMITTATANTTVATDGAVSVTAATTWDEVYGAGVANNDTITIAGTARDGVTPISGTYTVTDRTTDTIDGLLTAIEAAYSAQGTTVEATIRDGRVFVENLTAGASSLALTLSANNEGGGSLALGTFNQTTERDLDLGLVNGSYAGQDIAGTINGEAATGAGQVLRGATGNTNTTGLAVKYTGANDDVDAGTVKMTLGTAELFDRGLYGITDPFDGYLTFKNDSLQNQVNSMDDRIETMEAFLARKQEQMINRFVAMELTLSRLQNQSNWLAGQISALFSGWQ
ncbi:MAG: flagellar filament capping protein FliD [Syntrophales bacterium]